MYNSLVERCFKDCVDSFRRKDMEPAEEKVKNFFSPSVVFLFGFFFSKSSFLSLSSRVVAALTNENKKKTHTQKTQKKHTQKQCVTKCCEKYMKHSARTGVRFAELSSQAEQQIAQAMKK